MAGPVLPDVHAPVRGIPSGAGDGSFRRILVPVDSFGQSEEALLVAAQFSLAIGGLVRVIHVRTWDPPARGGARFFFESSEEATAVLDRAVTGVWTSGATASGAVVVAQRSRAAAAIAEAASEWRADLIVVARRPRSPLGVLLLGSFPDQVMRAARCPVLVVRQGRR